MDWVGITSDPKEGGWHFKSKDLISGSSGGICSLQSQSYEFILEVSRTQGNTIRPSSWEDPASSSHFMGSSQEQGWSRHYLAKLARKSTV